jgi:hypothetical protein
MRILSIVFLFHLSLIIISCSSCKTEEQLPKDDNYGNVVNPKLKFKKAGALAPGTILVRVDIQKIADQNDDLIYGKVIKVLKQGRSIPLVNNDDNIKIKFYNSLRKKISHIDSTSVLKIKFLSDSKNAEEKNLWQLISIE